MKKLYLADLKGYTDKQLISHICEEYETDFVNVAKYEFLIAYESVGDWGCDSTSFFLMKDKETGKLYENHGSHCSCYGFEGQFEPEETSVIYLQSSYFGFYTGWYDEEENENEKLVKEYISEL